MRNLLKFLWNLIPKSIHWRLMWILNPKFNVGLVGVFFNEKNEVLLLKHVMRRDYPWGLPSGFLLPNETIEAGILRELKEETNLDAKVTQLLQFKSGFKLRLEAILLGEVTLNLEKVKLNHEVYEVNFFTSSNLPDNIHPNHTKIILDTIKKARS